jgi:hypothetical protein
VALLILLGPLGLVVLLLMYAKHYIDCWIEVSHSLHMSSKDSLEDVLAEIDRLKSHSEKR